MAHQFTNSRTWIPGKPDRHVETEEKTLANSVGPGDNPLRREEEIPVAEAKASPERPNRSLEFCDQLRLRFSMRFLCV